MLNKLAEEFNRTYDIKPIQHEKDKLVLVNDLIFDELLEMSEEIDKRLRIIVDTVSRKSFIWKFSTFAIASNLLLAGLCPLMGF